MAQRAGYVEIEARYSRLVEAGRTVTAEYVSGVSLGALRRRAAQDGRRILAKAGTLTLVDSMGRTVLGKYTVDCEHCGEIHKAEKAHLSPFGGHQVYAVVCGDLTDYYTEEGLR